MTTKSDYTEEEWATLRRAPFVAGLAITLADPGGPIEATKEAMGTMRSVAEPGSTEELLVALSQDAMAMTQRRENPLDGFKPHGATASEQILDEVRAANRIVTDKATPSETEAFRAWLLRAASRAAEAAKEGGFMGFGAELVSQGERAMLDTLAGALANEPS
jgi:hypothetical protein